MINYKTDNKITLMNKYKKVKLVFNECHHKLIFTKDYVSIMVTFNGIIVINF